MSRHFLPWKSFFRDQSMTNIFGLLTFFFWFKNIKSTTMTCLKNVLPIFLKRLLNWIKLQLITLTYILVRPYSNFLWFLRRRVICSKVICSKNLLDSKILIARHMSSRFKINVNCSKKVEGFVFAKKKLCTCMAIRLGVRLG